MIYEDLGESLSHQDALSVTLGRIVAILRERRPGMLVIDSFKALRPFAADATVFRRFLQDLAGTLTAYPATSLWVGEYGADEIAVAPSSRLPTGSSRSPSNRRPTATRGSCRCRSSEAAGS